MAPVTLSASEMGATAPASVSVPVLAVDAPSRTPVIIAPGMATVSVVVAVTEGKLDFGPWEQIFYGEFDGRRPKRVLIKIIGE